MKEVIISDITIKQSKSASEFALTFREKIEVAKLLDRLGVSVIELSRIENTKVDSLLVKSVASAVSNSIIAIPVSFEDGSIETTVNALKTAKKARLQVAAPVSAVQMEYIFGKKPSVVIDMVKKAIAECKKYVDDVEFIADDATRADDKFLNEIVKTAIEAGAKTITLCDSEGTMLPKEFCDFLANLEAAVPELSSVNIAVSCANTLSMADSCAIAAVTNNGAAEIKAAAYPINTVSAADIATIISSRGDSFGASCSIRMTEMRRTVAEILKICQANHDSITGTAAANKPDMSGETLSAADDYDAIAAASVKLGYELTEEEMKKVFEVFKNVVKGKPSINYSELDIIIASNAMQVPPTYTLESYIITTGSMMTATSHIKMSKGGEVFETVGMGDGPVDASFVAIEQITGTHYDLDDFMVRSVTEGRDSMGECLVKLRSNGKLYSGRGVVTDVTHACILAYINALNKIVYEEGEE